MKKYDENLFQIGEVVKIMGVTRKALLVYEEMGLLEPAIKDKDSGYRYYSADNMTQIKAIRSLQTFGLTLKEVKEYLYDSDNIDEHLKRLTDLRSMLDKNIQILQVRAAKRGDLTVHKTFLQSQVCFVRHAFCTDVTDAANKLRETYIAAARTGKMSMSGKMFTIRTSKEPQVMDMLCCIPVENDFQGDERMEFPETPALCIYFRGPYEELPNATRALIAYVKQNNVEIAGQVRLIYLEGPPNRGKDSQNYVTQIAIPVKNGLAL